MNAKENLRHFLETLEEYKKSVSLTVNKFDNIEAIINIQAEELRKRSSDDLQYISLLLVQYSLYIQTELNRHLAIRDFCKDSISKKVALKSKDYDKYAKYDIIYYATINEDKEASYLNDMVNVANSRIMLLTGIVSKVEHQSKIIESISYTKRNQ